MALKPIPNREHPPSTSLFLLNQQCQKTDEQMSVPNPTFLSNQAAAINHSRIITLIQIPSSSPFPNQTQERVRWPPEATAALVLNRVIRATPPICQTVFYKITRKTGTNCNRWGICGRRDFRVDLVRPTHSLCRHSQRFAAPTACWEPFVHPAKAQSAPRRVFRTFPSAAI